MLRGILGVILILACGARLSAGENDDARRAAIHKSVERGLAIVAKGAKNYPEHRQCFSCHHQTLPLLAITTAHEVAKFDQQQDLVEAQFAFTRKTFENRKEALFKGERTDGAAITVAYGLWTYDIAGAPRDDVSDAMVANLLALQAEDGHWKPQSIRPPLAESLVSCTALSAYGLKKFAPTEQREAVDKAIERAGKYIAAAKLESTEDHAFALYWHARVEPNEQLQRAAREKLLALQRPDGGWAQLPDMESDAYATGQALVVLTEADADADAEAFRQGLDYLIKTQQDDGSWHVKTRARPVQKFFDNGDPHGKDQFISMAATAWATTALAKGLKQSLKR